MQCLSAESPSHDVPDEANTATALILMVLKIECDVGEVL